MLHYSDIKKYERCPKAFWWSRRIQKDFVPFVNYNESMSALVKELLMLQDEDIFEGEANDEPQKAIAAMHAKKALVNARFAYRDLRVKIPFLLQEEGRIIVYYTFRSCYPKEHEARRMAVDMQVLQHCGIVVDDIYAIHLRADYVRQEELNVKELLVITDALYNGKNRPHRGLRELIEKESQSLDLDAIIDELHATEALEKLSSKRSHVCTRGGKCAYYDDCFPEPLQDQSILHLVQAQHKYAMQEEGRTRLQDVDVDRMEGTRHQYAQIMADAQGGLYVDKPALRSWILDHMHAPLSYLDFEWETYAYPPYPGMKPFDVLPFQYSLHVETKQGLIHRGYIGEGDCRKDFILHLLNDIPKEGTILVYNMEGAEKLRLVQLSEQFPQYKEALTAVWERMVDLSLPFSTGNVYDVRMAGFYSLKKLVPIFSDYSYEQLDISYGMDAVAAWRRYCEAEAQEKQTLYEQLEAYCSMDTYAEVLIYHALRKLCDLT